MKIKRKKVDVSADDQILIGMIVSTEFLGMVNPIYNPILFQSAFGQTIAQWCIEYYEKYSLAPGIHIKDIFKEKLNTADDTDVMDLIGDCLSRISNEFKKTPHINAEYLFDTTKKLLIKKNVKELSEQIAFCAKEEDGDTEILQLLEEYKNEKIKTIEVKFTSSTETSTQLLTEKIKKPKAIIYPWLREKSLNMIFAERGLGKSWLAMIIAVSITRDTYEKISIGPWHVRHPCGVFYVDGEMGRFDLQDRFRQLIGPLGKESRQHALKIFSAPDYTEKHNKTVNLYNFEWQDKFYEYFKKNRSCRVLILDNLSSLCSGRDENDNQSTSVFTAWLIKLRALGVSVIIIHHQGKSKGHQRGASSLEDPLNNTIHLTKPDNWNIHEGAFFHVNFTKARNNPGGEAYRPFELKIIEDETSRKFRVWEDS